MKRPFIIVAAIAILAVINFSYMPTPDSQARTIVTKMLSAVQAHKGCTYTMRGNERIVGMKALRGGDIYTKLNLNPLKIYMKMVSDPNKGTEILFVKGERSDKALVNPGKFLPTVKLAPTSGLLTKDQHHTLVSAGFVFLGKVVAEGIRKADEQKKFDSVFKYTADVTWNGRNCYKIIVEDPTWKWTTYKAAKGETMVSIGNKLLIPEYCMVEYNGVGSFDEDLGGKTLKVPTSYAKKTVLYIDKENNFPIYQEMSDDKGVFERYEFYNLVVNPAFKANEFTEDFEGYGF